MRMQPVLLTVGPLSISSFGFFLALGLLVAVFVLWKLARTYELKEETILDLSLLTFFGGLLGARIYTVIFNTSFFDNLDKIFLVNRYPGLSFWGGFLGGVLALYVFSKRLKLNFWQIADLAAVGFVAGLIVGNIGCFLGGCSFGVVSNLPIATSIVGLIGKRLPITLIESLLLLPVFFHLKGQLFKFHIQGLIGVNFLIFLGVIKFITEFYRGEGISIAYLGGISLGHLYSIALIFSGVFFYYLRAKRNILVDMTNFLTILTSSKKRNLTLFTLKKSCYNHRVNLQVKVREIIQLLQKLPKILKRRLNVKSNPTNN